MKFVAPEQAPEQAEIIRNTLFWPDVDLSEFRSVMRTDGTVTQPRLKQVALSAISEVNAELYEFRRRQQMLGYASLAEVPAEQLDGKSERIQHYFNAVYCWARAMLNERYPVSYTHLDVYKRQSNRFPQRFCYLHNPLLTYSQHPLCILLNSHMCQNHMCILFVSDDLV